MRISLIAAALLMAGSAASAQNTRHLDVSDPTAKQPATAVLEDRKVCRVEKQLGSNRSKRICRSAAQMELDRERAREELSKATSQIN